MIWTLSKITDICKGELLGQDGTVDFFVTDSRRIHLPQRTVFIAIRGDRHNGHEFIKDAMRSGVTSFIVDDSSFIDQEGSFVLVQDSLKAFQSIAEAHRHSFDYPVIGITGSYGKTKLKDLLASKLSHHFHIVRSPRSYNSQTGVPLSLMDMRAEHDLAIFEAGVSQIGEMQALADIIDPDIGILTTIGDAHSEGFKDEGQKIREKAELFKNAEVIIYPYDHPEIDEQLSSLYPAGEKIMAHWGWKEGAFLHVLDVKANPSGAVLSYCTGGSSHELAIPYSSGYHLENTLTLLTTLHILGFDQKDIKDFLLEGEKRYDHWEFIRTSYGKGLLVDVGSIDGPSIRTAKEQLNSLVNHKGITLILNGQGGSPIGNDKRLQEIADEATGCDPIYIGPGHEGLLNILPGLKHFTNNEEFISRLGTVLNPEHSIILHGEWTPSFVELQSRLQEKSHQTVVTVNMTSLIHNLNEYRSMLPENTRVMAMVKAFAYGSGETEIARSLQYHKVDYLAVAYPDEGVTLRNAGVNLPIMVMNSSASEYSVLIDFELEPEIFSISSLHSFLDFCVNNDLKKYPIHIKVDTGMHRLGLEPSEVGEVLALIKNSDRIRVVSVFSHLFASDAPDLSLSKAQILEFEKVKEKFDEALDYKVLYHILNSSGISRLAEASFDMVRLGIGLYGYTADRQMSKRLLPVLAWRTKISQIKQVKAGETVGYGGRLRLEADKSIAVIPVGYADGLSRGLGNGVGQVYIEGSRCPFIGNICMDMSMVDVTGLTCREGSNVELIGDHISLENIAQDLDTIPYEVMTSIPPRIKRHYIFNG